MDGRDQWIAGNSGPRIASRIFLPTERKGPHPVIIFATGLGSVKENRTASFVKPFLDAGFASITFDYATWGGSEGQPRHLVNPAERYRDVCNVAWAKEFKSFDRMRIVIWGSSFGGLHVTRLLAEDHTIAAGIAQCPCVDTALAGKMKPRSTTLQLAFWGICDSISALFGMSPIYVRIARMDDDTIGGPAMMEADDVASGYALVINDKYSQGPLRNRMLARSVLSMRNYRPAQLASEIVAPYLIVLPEYDTVAPLEEAKRVARVVKSAESLTVPGGHFDLYEGRIGFEDNLKAQLDFLTRIIPVQPKL